MGLLVLAIKYLVRECVLFYGEEVIIYLVISVSLITKKLPSFFCYSLWKYEKQDPVCGLMQFSKFNFKRLMSHFMQSDVMG